MVINGIQYGMKQGMAVLFGLLLMPFEALAESKFLSLKKGGQMKFKLFKAALVFSLLCGAGAQATPLYFQPIQVCDDSGGDCAASSYFQAETNKIWAQAGIEINFLDVVQIHDSSLLNVSTAGHPSSAGAPSFFDLMSAGKTAVNDWDSSGIINLFFTEALNEDTANPDEFAAYGWACGGGSLVTPGCVSSPAIFVSERVFNESRTDTIAHEIGHMLGLLHTDIDPEFLSVPTDNLMTAGGSGRLTPTSLADITPDGALLSMLTNNQIQTALASDYLTKEVVLPSPVPSPSPLLLIGLGLMVLRMWSHIFS